MLLHFHPFSKGGVQMFRYVLFAVLFLSQHAIAQSPLDDVEPTLGLYVVDTRDAITQWKKVNLPMRYSPKKGIMVTAVIVGSEAFKAGVKQYDLVETVNSAPVRTVARMSELLVGKKPGDVVELQIRRLSPTGWQPIKGKMRCGTARTNAYSQMETGGSKVSGNMFAEHVWFQAERDYLAPFIIIPADGKPSLGVEISCITESIFTPTELTVKAGNDTAKIKLNVLSTTSQALRDDDGLRIHHKHRVSATPELVALLRSSKEKIYRVDSLQTYTESAIDSTDQAAADVVFSVFDDMLATGNRDFTLQGRVKN
jgi:hypothetical protein